MDSVQDRVLLALGVLTNSQVNQIVNFIESRDMSSSEDPSIFNEILSDAMSPHVPASTRENPLGEQNSVANVSIAPSTRPTGLVAGSPQQQSGLANNVKKQKFESEVHIDILPKREVTFSSNHVYDAPTFSKPPPPPVVSRGVLSTLGSRPPPLVRLLQLLSHRLH